MKVTSWRDNSNYRSNYFKKNRGFGRPGTPLKDRYWFCALCIKPLKGPRNVQVDHITPGSVLANKKYNKQGQLVSNTSAYARAANTTLNLCSMCPKCNRDKSNKVGLVTIRAYCAKILQSLAFKTQSGFFMWIGILFIFISFIVIKLLGTFLPKALKVSALLGKYILKFLQFVVYSLLIKFVLGTVVRILYSFIKSKSIPYPAKLVVLLMLGGFVYYVYLRS